MKAKAYEQERIPRTLVVGERQVYCAVVPDGRAFTLEDNIYTGNCGGFCIKAGQGHFAHLLKMMPERYLYHEQKEQEIREYLGKDVAILRDRRDGKTKPLTLRDLRMRIQAKSNNVDYDEFGGCGCFID